MAHALQQYVIVLQLSWWSLYHSNSFFVNCIQKYISNFAVTDLGMSALTTKILDIFWDIIQVIL